jgi:hypothetical protein
MYIFRLSRTELRKAKRIVAYNYYAQISLGDRLISDELIHTGIASTDPEDLSLHNAKAQEIYKAYVEKIKHSSSSIEPECKPKIFGAK